MTTRNEESSPSYGADPVAYLEAIASSAPSKELLSRVAGPVASSMKEEATAGIAPLYLRAAAQQLAAEMATARAPVLAAAASAAGTTAAAAAQVDVEAEMKAVQQIYEIAEAIGHAVTHCTPRSTISQSGILSAMANLLLYNTSHTTNVNTLSNVHVEFLQACLYAEQYRYAERIIGNRWPRPNATVSVRQVLRYFYIRGTIHMGCNNWKMAVRCFWTCLSVPAEIVSAVAVAAWKKMVLCKCLIQSDQATVSSAGPLATPRAAPACLGRFLNLASSSSLKSLTSSAPTSGYDINNNNNNISNSAAGLGNRQPEEAMNMVEGTSGSSEGSMSTGQRQSSYVGLGVKVYMELVHAFCQVDRQAFARILQEHASLFTADGNVGIVRKCESELIRRQVYQLSRIYSVISLEQLSTLVELPVEEVQTLLLQLAIEKMWMIQMEDGMVVFPKLTEQTSVEDAQDVEELIQLTKTVQKLDVSVASSSKYHTFVRRENSAKNSEGKGGPRGVEDV